MEPQFTQLPELKIAGLGARFISVLSPNKNNSTIIPALWHDFIRHYDSIPNKSGDASLGLVEMLPQSEPKSDPAEMFYIACTPVATFDDVPASLLRRVIPAGRYARFTHKGRLTTLGATMHFIYREWLPQSKLQLRHAPHLEWYDRRFNAESDQSEFDILLPIN